MKDMTFDENNEELCVVELKKELLDSTDKYDKLVECVKGIEASLINLRPRDKSAFDRRFGELIKECVRAIEVKEK